MQCFGNLNSCTFDFTAFDTGQRVDHVSKISGRHQILMLLLVLFLYVELCVTAPINLFCVTPTAVILIPSEHAMLRQSHRE